MGSIICVEFPEKVPFLAWINGNLFPYRDHCILGFLS